MTPTTHKHKPAANTAATFTITGVSDLRKTLMGIQYSYSAAPTGGNLKVESPSGTTIFEQDITAAGPGAVSFPQGLPGATGEDVIVTLAAGSGTVVGSVNGQSIDMFP